MTLATITPKTPLKSVMKNGEYLTVKRSPSQLIARSNKLHFSLLQFIASSVIIFFGNLGHSVWMLNNNLMALRIAADILCVSFYLLSDLYGFLACPQIRRG